MQAYKCDNNRLQNIVERIDVNIDETLPEKEIEDHEVDPLIEENEEEPGKEEKDQEKKGKRTISNPFKGKIPPKTSPGRVGYWQCR